MMGLNFDLSSFHIKLMAAILYTVGALFAFAMFPLFNGAAQGFHLEARQEGSCETKSGARFDRVVYMSGLTVGTAANTIKSGTNVNLQGGAFIGASGEESDSNKYDWSKAYTVAANSSKCSIIGGLTTADFFGATTGNTGVTARFLTADGAEVSITFDEDGTTNDDLGSADVGNSAVWSSPANFLQDNRTIVNVVIGVLVLIIGVGPIAILGGIGKYLLDTFAGGMSGAMKFLVATLGAVIAITLMGTFVDFIDIAYDAVDSERFSMYDASIASLAATIKQYWGLIFVAGWVALGSYFGWQAFQRMRGRGSASGSQVMG